MSRVIGSLVNKVVESTTSLFSHGPKALEHTLDHLGDPGLLGPDSVSWRVIGDADSAGHPEMAAWVHNVLTDSFLAAYQTYGRHRPGMTEADRFVSEQARIGALLDASPLPETAASSRNGSRRPRHWQARQRRRRLEVPPGPAAADRRKLGYRLLFNAAVPTIQPAIRALISLQPGRGSEQVGRATVRALRWALDSSPSWRLALVRSGAAVPFGLLRQPLPARAPGQSGKGSV